MKKMKKAILVVSFGTSYDDALKSCIESTENFIKENFKEYEVRRAFTSYMIINKILKRDNIKINTPYEALLKLKMDGFEEVIVQPLHIMFGEEYEKVEKAVEIFKDDFKELKLGRPLLYNNKDYSIASKAVKNQLPDIKKDLAVVLMGHGTEHRANASYFQFDYYLKEHINSNLYICNVESEPSIYNVVPKLKEKNIREVLLMPFMLVAGEHANIDMASDEEDSFKSILEHHGFKVNVSLKGLGENKEIQQIYVNHIKDEMN
ncbi:sirohydrochlorin cobaltochelatase [Clostridium niameyense]|uniref:Sirohydrochlorin cobaltochelatase n=1 Tax=Clostridium niameyense TaxID=1622073 RepID=A0A6M0R9V4_9CLOT|nr:sirohydrochlorin cobaltochelatase [Clostridium niameyense]NEZ46982.1 sirohydrochlorin cobaltochelatase [Clostridium niameyense]